MPEVPRGSDSDMVKKALQEYNKAVAKKKVLIASVLEVKACHPDFPLGQAVAIAQRSVDLGLSADEMARTLKDISYRRVALATRPPSPYHQAMAGMRVVYENARLTSTLIEGVRQSVSQFFAMAAEMQPGFAVYHNAYHANEMFKDISALMTERLADSKGADFLAVLTGAMGAAHDIIQHHMAPQNEDKSGEIFTAVMRTILEGAKEGASPAQAQAIQTFIKDALPVMTREVLVNGTYLHFGSKHNHTSLMNHLEKDLAGKVTLDPFLSVASAATSLSDVSRGLNKRVMKQHAVLTSVPKELKAGQEKLLEMVGLKESSDNEQEGFLIRIAQNFRMSAELGIKLDFLGRTDAATGSQAAIKSIRDGQLAGVSDEQLPLLMQDFIGSLGSEIAFASGLAKNSAGVIKACFAPATVKDSLWAARNAYNEANENFSVNGWDEHVLCLIKLQSNYAAANEDEKLAMAKSLLVMAAMQPGMLMEKEQILGMEDRLKFLLAKKAHLKDKTNRDPGEDVLAEYDAPDEPRQGFTLDKRIASLTETFKEVCQYNGYNSALLEEVVAEEPNKTRYSM